jgi:DNA-binding beta-propeller fold protein YncE
MRAAREVDLLRSLAARDLPLPRSPRGTGLFALLLIACDPSAVPDASVDASIDAGDDAGWPEITAVLEAPRYGIAGEEITLDASSSSSATEYTFVLGDGRRIEGAGAIVRTTYEAPGRYRVLLMVSDEIGRQRMTSALVTITHPITHTPRASSSVAIDPLNEHVAVVSPDTDELAVFTFDGELVARHPTADDPRTVARFGDRWAVVCQTGGVVQLIGAGTIDVAMPRASRPFGIVATEDRMYVSLQAIGQLATIDASMNVTVEDAITDARGVSILPDGRVAVTRWRSPDTRGEIAVIGATDELWTLAYDPQPGSDTENGGVPSYLGPLIVAPTGRAAIVPSLQAAIGEGSFVGPRPLTFETTLRAVISYVDPVSGVETFERRKQFDDRGLASAGVFSSRGDYFFAAMRGNRAVERVDALTGSQAGTIPDVGFALQGVALSPDDALLFVDAYLSRELVVYDVSDPGALPTLVRRLPIVSAEPHDPEVLLGARLFSDAVDERIGLDGYMACAHCHLDGLGDARVWDFTDRGEGLRNTIDLIGRAGLADGPLHWTANFDEVQDFEHDIRGPFRGTGLMSDDVYHVGTRDTPLGDPKAGASEELDALAAYVTSLSEHHASPHRDPDGALTEAAVRGRVIFEAAGCASCHAGARMTDSGVALHDVGTLGPGSGSRLGETLTGIDTPTLHGVWESAPYLHDGSAPTLRDVLTVRNAGDRHGATSALSSAQIDDLIAYLLCLDGNVD